MQASLLLAAFSPLAAQNSPKPDSEVKSESNVEDPTQTESDAAQPTEPQADTSATQTPAQPKAATPKRATPKVTTPAKPVRKGPTDALKPGQFIFEKHDSYDGAIKIVAVLDIQRLYVYMDDELIAFSTISAGKKGKETPTGYFNILQKNVDHKSNIYSNAPMPYMQRLTWDGIALHAGKIPGFAASHGCIRMPLNFAKSLYGITKTGQEVLVLKDLYSPRPVKPTPVVAPPAIITPSTQTPITKPATTPVTAAATVIQF